MMGGGLLWAFDIRSVEEFKGRVRARRGVDGKWSQLGKRDEDEEEEFEKWVASLTGRKKGVGKEERRWSAREPDQEQAREENYAVIESQATNGLEKPG